MLEISSESESLKDVLERTIKMSKTTRTNYICNGCGETALFAKKPNFCPCCGSTDIVKNNMKSKKHAKEMIQQMKDLIPEMDDAWKVYVETYVEFENINRKIATYVKRGIIDKSDVPVFTKKRLIDELYEYRRKAKENG